MRTADDNVADRLRDDLITLFDAQNKRLQVQDERLVKQQDLIDKLQQLVDSLREGNRDLQTEKDELERQNLHLMHKLAQWESARKSIQDTHDANGSHASEANA
jgi:predicted  nucleic acid-binding Zn-ribbon protein